MTLNKSGTWIGGWGQFDLPRQYGECFCGLGYPTPPGLGPLGVFTGPADETHAAFLYQEEMPWQEDGLDGILQTYGNDIGISGVLGEIRFYDKGLWYLFFGDPFAQYVWFPDPTIVVCRGTIWYGMIPR